MAQEQNQPEQTKTKQTVWQFVKFALFSASAGLIQIGSFTLLNEVVLKTAWLESLMAQHPGFARIMENEYGPCYLIALILSVIWNFTINRKFTFKAANNIPIAMLKVFGYYLVFTPVSTLLGNYFTARFAEQAAVEYIVLGVTMATNMITEYLFCKFVVYRGAENTAEPKSKKEKTRQEEHADV